MALKLGDGVKGMKLGNVRAEGKEKRNQKNQKNQQIYQNGIIVLNSP
jgi:hypothetical protein